MEATGADVLAGELTLSATAFDNDDDVFVSLQMECEKQHVAWK